MRSCPRRFEDGGDDLALASAVRAAIEALAGRTDLIVAIGREGKGHRVINEVSLPQTAAMAQKMKAPQARDTYRRRKWLAEPPNGWIKSSLLMPLATCRPRARVKTCEVVQVSWVAVDHSISTTPHHPS